VEGFSGMKSSLDSEKRAMQRIWKEREKQIDKVIENTIDMYGSIETVQLSVSANFTSNEEKTDN